MSTAARAAPTTEPSRTARLRHGLDRRRRRAITLALVAGATVLLLAFVIDGALSARRMLAGVTKARDGLLAGAEALVTGDPTAASAGFSDAVEGADIVAAAADHPAIRLAASIPFLGDNVGAVEAVADSATETATAGQIYVRAARRLGWRDILVPGMESLGGVDLERMELAAPLLSQGRVHLERAVSLLDAADSGRLVGPVRTGMDDALESAKWRLQLGRIVEGLSGLVPPMVGGDEPRRYLVLFRDPSGAGTQAPASVAGVLSASDGTLRIDRAFAPASRIDFDLPDTISGGYVTSDARAALEVAHAAGLGPLDGLIVTDDEWLSGMLFAAGPVDTRAWPETLYAWNAKKVIGNGVAGAVPPARIDAARAEILQDVWDAILSRHPSTEALAPTLASLTGEGHLVFYSNVKEEQASLERLGAGG